jgi:hypothetical protein
LQHRQSLAAGLTAMLWCMHEPLLSAVLATRCHLPPNGGACKTLGNPWGARVAGQEGGRAGRRGVPAPGGRGGGIFAREGAADAEAPQHQPVGAPRAQARHQRHRRGCGLPGLGVPMDALFTLACFQMAVEEACGLPDLLLGANVSQRMDALSWARFPHLSCCMRGV